MSLGPAQQEIVDQLKAAIEKEMVDQGADPAVAKATTEEFVQTILDEADKSGNPPGIGLDPEAVHGLNERLATISQRSPEEGSDSDVVSEQERVQDQ